MIGPIYATPIRNCEANSHVPLIKPIRILQFILTLTLLILTVQTIYDESPYNAIEAAALIAVFACYLFIVSIDILCQCSSDPIPDTPMFIFGLVGTILFIIAAGKTYTCLPDDDHSDRGKEADEDDSKRLVACLVLSIACAIFYFLDIMLIFLYGY